MMEIITWQPAMIIDGVSGPPNMRWSSTEERMIAPVTANVLRIESPYLIDKATSNPPAAPKHASREAIQDHPAKNTD